jgi:signal transduction histidine kinase/streptogramin lyase
VCGDGNPPPPEFYPLAGEPNGIQGLTEGGDGALLIAVGGGVARLVDGKAAMAYPFPSPVRQFHGWRLLRDRDGGLWVGTLGGGLVHVHQGRTDAFAQSDGFSHDAVSALFEDREGNIWVATSNGLDRFRDFAVATFSVNQNSSAPGPVIAARDGSVWLDTNEGLSRWNNGQITIYHDRASQIAPSKPGTLRRVREVSVSGLPKPGLLSLFQDDRGRIWVAGDSGAGYLENDRFVSTGGVPGGIVYSIAGDTRGNLWIANLDHGLFHLLDGSLVQQIPWARLDRKDNAVALAADPLRGALWLGFFQGGVMYFRDGQVRSLYTAADGLGEGRVGDLWLDQDGTLWAATEGGLSRIKDGRVATLNSKEGLPCDAVHWVMEDDAHSFWLNTPCGLVRIARSELDAWAAVADKDKDSKVTIRATVFDSSDGVRSSAYFPTVSPPVAKTPDGKLWFTTLAGVSAIDPGRLPFNTLSPPVHIEQITVDRKLLWQNLSAAAASNLRLPALSRDLQIDYTALSLVAPEKIRFRVKLEGRDSDWQDMGNERKKAYNDLPPRRYRFRVIASNNNGVWNEAGDTLEFLIEPAYYQTNWFRASLAAVFAAILFGLYQLRLYQVAREFSAQTGERARIARDLHDTLLQSFHASLIQMQTARNVFPRRPEEGIQTLDNAIGSAEQAIDEGRRTIQDLRATVASRSNLEYLLTAAAQELAQAPESNGTNPEFGVTVEGARQILSPTLQDEVYRIGREVLRNAFRHAQASHIEAEIRYDTRNLRLRIRDDGKGIDRHILEEGARAGHWGLPGIRERAKRIGGQFDIWSEAGAGTEIQLTVPASRAYAQPQGQRRFGLFRKKTDVV